MTTDASVTLFISYAHNDEELRRQLDKHLAPLQRRKIIDAWHDRKIEAGQRWAEEIDEKLNHADLILLLISPDFVASDYCSDIELKKAMKRHAAGESKVVPIILEPCDWKCYDFGQLQAFPKDGKAITLWSNRNAAFLDVAEGIGRVAEDLFEQRKKKLEEKAFAEQQYKTKVAEALSDGEISPLEQKTLDELRDTLGLTLEEAEEIKTKAYQPIKEYLDHLDKYKNDLNEIIAAEYPLSERTKADLKQRQRDLGVKEEDAKKIEEPILAEAAERARQQDLPAQRAREATAQARERAREAQHDRKELRASQDEAQRQQEVDRMRQQDLQVQRDQEQLQGAQVRQREPQVQCDQDKGASTLPCGTQPNRSPRRFLLQKTCLLAGGSTAFVFAVVLTFFLLARTHQQVEQAPQQQVERPPQQQVERPPQQQVERPPQQQVERPPQQQVERPPQQQVERPAPIVTARPSFDCTKASLPTEWLICGNDALSTLDADMVSLYREIYKRTEDKAALKEVQLSWLRQRNICRDVPCVQRAYEERIDGLKLSR
jgi:hypothetical protein